MSGIRGIAARDLGGVDVRPSLRSPGGTRQQQKLSRDAAASTLRRRLMASGSERAALIARVLDVGRGMDPALGLGQVCREVLGVAGASVMLVDAATGSTLSSSGAIASRLEDLQQTLGEGPGLDAHTSGRPVLEPNLAHATNPRWIAFAPAAVAAGAGAVFAFPLRVGGIRLGALMLHQTEARELSDKQHSDATAVVAAAVQVILALQSGAPPGTLSPALGVLNGSAALHQASGIVSVQLEVNLGEALVRLRAHAFASATSLAEVAAEVVSGHLRFDHLMGST